MTRTTTKTRTTTWTTTATFDTDEGEGGSSHRGSLRLLWTAAPLKLTTVGSGVEVEDDNEDDDDTQPSNAGGHCDGAGLEAMGALTMTNLGTSRS